MHTGTVNTLSSHCLPRIHLHLIQPVGGNLCWMHLFDQALKGWDDVDVIRTTGHTKIHTYTGNTHSPVPSSDYWKTFSDALQL